MVGLVAAGIAAFGITRLQIDDSLSPLSRSNTPEFTQCERESRRFPSSEFDVLILIHGKTLLQRASIEALRQPAIELQSIDGTRGVISIFSARTPPQGGELPGPLFPATLPQGAAYQHLVQHLRSNEIINGKLLSNDGTLTLMVLAIEPDVVEGQPSRSIVLVGPVSIR
jgi:uncharacterized protein